MRRRLVLAALAAPVLLSLAPAAQAEEPTWPDVREIARRVVDDSFRTDCFQEFVTRPARPYQFATVEGATVTIYGENVVGAAGNEAGYVVRYVDCSV